IVRVGAYPEVIEGAPVQTFVRLAISAGGTGSATLRYGSNVANTPRVTEGRLYTFSAWVYQDSGAAKTIRALISFRNDAYEGLAASSSTTIANSGVWTKVSVTAVAPVNASSAVVTAGVINGMPGSTRVNVTATVLAEGVENDRWFDG